ncbi:MAG: peptide deformylase [Synergistaceae bacterium]|jgi:peptide deformylase|nr:peptide deformylase [Synergistaceae bacterium]
MAVLEVLKYPNPALRKETSEVTEWDGKLKKLISDMWETMYLSKGVGLAAPQVGIPMKLVVIDYEGDRYVVINPEIIEEDGAERSNEGCLSFPGIYEDVTRPTRVRVLYTCEKGERRDVIVEGFLARVFSHEIDHLRGRLMIDYLSPLKRGFLKKKMEKAAREGE